MSSTEGTGLRYGVKQIQRSVDELLAVWPIVDDAGFDHYWVMDHLASIRAGRADGDLLDAWSVLAGMAVATTRVRLGCMVTANTFRHPGVLAKMAVTVDHLSGGRLEFGIGAGWAEIEHTMFDLPFGTPGERLDRLEEACKIIRSLWTRPVTTFQGRHYKITDAVAEPKPVQDRVPIWIGGNGPKRTLRIAARFADVWSAAGGEPDEIAELSAVLDQHCSDVGRDPAEIRRCVQLQCAEDDDATLRRVEQYVAVGVTEVILNLSPPDAVGEVERAANLLGRLRSVG
jgi:F420-dependent oxidoreductase-like protein